MAKSVRASVQKRNRAKLRATVFGPVVDARTERLSAKLQELASQPKPSNEEKLDTALDMKDRQEETKILQPNEGQHNLLEIAPACGFCHREIAMKVATSKWTILIANILVPISILVFSSGFFPYKNLLPGFATNEHTNNSQIPPGVFDKVVFMVVDALRSDFVYSQNSGFLFTQSLIRSGAALPFTAYASAPTVTMPRLKAITTEADTSATLTHQDTWLAQLKAKGGKMVMYGDDTWLKLFPGMFHRADGTTSFFVSDFTEVDNNVTRHIPSELLQDDWSALIMHFLGLDHIGHKAGPNSPYMIAKQHEMDSVVNMVYTALEQEKHLETTLFVLCGDHGMNDAGNHGGSSVGETSPALLFISPKFQRLETRNDSPTEEFSDLQYYHTVEQTDITPTLAGLLGLPIPLNSLGVFIPELLVMWDYGKDLLSFGLNKKAKSSPLISTSGPHRIHMLLENAKQLLKTVKGSFPSYSFEFNLMPANCSSQSLTDIERVQCAWFRVLELLNRSGADYDRGASSEVESALLLFLRSAQGLMSRAASDYNLLRLYIGLSIAGFAISLTFFPVKRLLVNFAPAGIFLGFSILSYSTMMFASSYVEEEQQFWYWVSMGWVVYLHLKYAGYFHRKSIQKSGPAEGYWPFVPSLPRFGAATLAVSYRVLRRWNQTGQKFAAQPDITGSFFPSHQHTLWALVILTYADTCLHLLFDLPASMLWRFISCVVTLAAFLFKLSLAASDSPELLGNSFLQPVAMVADGMHLLYHARMVLCGISLLMIYSMYVGKARGSIHKGTGKY
ncbi:GPI ethanolamine phosphate transferase 2 [Aspergillus nomiae NRRL 13137]|uniref:GPI ethanolamine phosphate transferase 2 n=1 Tax=Aspergillus nomiae NRRL (strain ATCC 15546 / NRRL 13137 / CBS 260.88 / M93) TaxID=1509407 RepID=A0A0L1IR88_ASPN3|nr:GPI ethanolamine phosphate transferase 2 [Aspergillus nomiae NRRL 13137]KNG81984.1 GPI ethanolamine phosphate transferase 2 [Aspergillus nomiae NRRL 13137]